jgi:hypothetical protein
MTRVLSIVSLAVLTQLSVSCGGGGDATPNSQPQLGDLNTDNKENAGAIAYQGAITAFELIRQPNPSWNINDFQIVNGTVTVFLNQLCKSGSGTIIYTQGDISSYKTTWNNCEFNTNLYFGFLGAKLNGEVIGTGFTTTSGEKGTLEFKNLTIIGSNSPYMTINGKVQFAIDGTRNNFEVSANQGGENLTIVYGELPGLSNHNLNVFKFTLNEDPQGIKSLMIDSLNYSSSFVPNSSLQAFTPVALITRFNDSSPYLGTLKVRAEDNTNAEFVVVDNTGMRLFFDGDGDGAVATDGFGLDEQIDVGWDQLDFNTFDFYPFFP